MENITVPSQEPTKRHNAEINGSWGAQHNRHISIIDPASLVQKMPRKGVVETVRPKYQQVCYGAVFLRNGSIHMPRTMAISIDVLM